MKKNQCKRVLAMLILAAVYIGLTGCSSIEQGSRNEIMWNHEQSFQIEDYTAIVLPEDREFKILVLADVQLESSLLKDSRALAFVRELAAQSNPDLILTVGDNASWINADKRTLKFISTMEELEIPWAVTLGNHDREGNADEYWIGNRYEEAEYSLFRSGPSNIHGVGNFMLNLTDTDGKSRYGLVLMDSNSIRNHEGKFVYDYIYYDQIQWYKWLIKGLEKETGSLVPTMAFFHIPLPEFADAIKAVKDGQIPSDEVFGTVGEAVACSPLNSGFFDVIKDMKSTKYIFNGHDHVNNISIPYEGVRMTYVQKSGPGSYTDKELQGGTLITIAPGTFEVNIEHISLIEK